MLYGRRSMSVRIVIFGTCGSATLEPIQMKFSTYDYVHHSTPRAKYNGRPQRRWVRWGWVKLHPRVFFWISRSHALPTSRSVDFCSMQICVSMVGAFLWGNWGNLFPGVQRADEGHNFIVVIIIIIVA